MKRCIQGALLVSIVTIVAACASTPRISDSEKRALYRDHAGEPVKGFRYSGNINGWTPLGDKALLVWTRPSEAYLLDLAGPCPDLDFAPAITITHRMGEVSARFDSVIPHGAGAGPMRVPCRISDIRPVDVKAARQAESDLRKAEVAERSATESAK